MVQPVRGYGVCGGESVQQAQPHFRPSFGKISHRTFVVNQAKINCTAGDASFKNVQFQNNCLGLPTLFFTLLHFCYQAQKLGMHIFKQTFGPSMRSTRVHKCALASSLGCGMTILWSLFLWEGSEDLSKYSNSAGEGSGCVSDWTNTVEWSSSWRELNHWR